MFCWIKGMNNDLVYQLEQQNNVMKLSKNKLLHTLNYTWVKLKIIGYNIIQRVFFKNQLKIVNMFTTSRI